MLKVEASSPRVSRDIFDTSREALEAVEMAVFRGRPRRPCDEGESHVAVFDEGFIPQVTSETTWASPVNGRNA